jgi:hypothetical protein
MLEVASLFSSRLVCCSPIFAVQKPVFKIDAGRIAIRREARSLFFPDGREYSGD